jgi:hypothetical protein
VAQEAISDGDRDILAFEAAHPHHGPAKDEAIREAFSLVPARYYQILNAVIDSPAAVQHDPMLIARLQRAREARAQARADRAFTSVAAPGRDRPTETIEHYGEVSQRPV